MEWFLDHAWLVPLIPAVSFVIIILFGKRLPRRGSEVGLLAVGSSFVLSVLAAVAWIQRVEDAGGGEGGSALGLLGRSIGRLTAGGEAAFTVEPVVHQVTWFRTGFLDFSAGIHIDGLAVMMMFVVTLISFLVHYYSTEYLRDDRRYTHYFAALSLFTASMLTLVVASNTLMLLVGWELVGLCSFMLIGHWWEEKPNSDAALKAFLTTRTGDIGLLCGVIMTMFLVERNTGTASFDITAVNKAAIAFGESGTNQTLLMWCALALLLGIIGKSGQFPLHTWLPDAMAGPTPVSALIHAATMVVAGVYLGARVYPVFFYGLDIGAGGVNAMALIGGITVIVGASLAFVQSDIKKVLAYSTISQLGYMVMGLGVGAWIAAIFHLFTHAFFKANLFLGAGSVSHSGAHHSFDMKKDMGGLRHYMPKTFITFMIGTAALIGVPFTAGFFSKDEVLATAGATDFAFFKIVGLVGAFMTACYMTRCVYLTFFGEYRGGHHDDAHGHDAHAAHGHDAHAAHDDHGHDAHGADGHGAHAGHGHDDHHAGPHESPHQILIPLYVLSVLSIASGYLLAPMLYKLTGAEIFEKFLLWIEPKLVLVGGFPELTHPTFSWLDPILATAAGLLGVGVAYLFYWRKAFGQNLTERNAVARGLKSVLERKYGLDTLYTTWIVGAVKGPMARACYWVNQHVIDAVVKGAGVVTAIVGRFTYRHIDQGVIDGAIDGIAVGTGRSGGALARTVQTGRLQAYALLFLVAVVGFAVALWIGAS